MGRIFGYGLASFDAAQISLLSQEFLATMYAQLHPDGEWSGWFAEAASAAKLPWFQRPMGEKLFRELHPMDTVVVSNFDRIFGGLADAVETMAILQEKLVRLVILELEVDTATKFGRHFLHFLEILRETSQGMITRRKASTQANPQAILRNKRDPRTFAPIGWRWRAWHHGSRLVPCEEDRKWALEIVRMVHDDGLTLKEITQWFQKEGIKPVHKAEVYDQRRVQHAYVAALCGFQRIYQRDLPNIRDLFKYLALHDGQLPQLQPFATRRGLFYTLPPMPGPGPVPVPRILFAHLAPCEPVYGPARGMPRVLPSRKHSDSSVYIPLSRRLPSTPTPSDPSADPDLPHSTSPESKSPPASPVSDTDPASTA